MTITFTPNDKGNPAGKLADAELQFSGGPLDGLKLVGFGVWERRAGGRNVTYSDTIVSRWRDRVHVRTPLAAAVAPSSRRCSRTNGSHR